MVGFFKLLLEESKILHDCCTVSNVCCAHASLLNFIFARFHVLDNVVIKYDCNILNLFKELSIAGLRMYTHTLFLRFEVG
jgi:hypothetical protein